jgi:ATP-dependent Lon protease
LPGYTQLEKLEIAKKYLVPKQLDENGLVQNVTDISMAKKTKKVKALKILNKVEITDGALAVIIDSYTREAGVRNLEREIGNVFRSLASKIAGGSKKSFTIDAKDIRKYLGPIRYESEMAQRTSVPGVATGLAFTPVGGEIIFIEVTSMPGKGGLMLTGQIGDVMKESAQAAFSLLRSRTDELGIDSEALQKKDYHVHVPQGAVPKDGPSAGGAIFTAMVSLEKNISVRHNVAMTGEITLRGLVLPIGGVKEKVLAAKRAGITDVILPARNRKDLVDVPAEIKKSINFHFASNVDNVLKIAMCKS